MHTHACESIILVLLFTLPPFDSPSFDCPYSLISLSLSLSLSLLYTCIRKYNSSLWIATNSKNSLDSDKCIIYILYYKFEWICSLWLRRNMKSLPVCLYIFYVSMHCLSALERYYRATAGSIYEPFRCVLLLAGWLTGWRLAHQCITYTHDRER